MTLQLLLVLTVLVSFLQAHPPAHRGYGMPNYKSRQIYEYGYDIDDGNGNKHWKKEENNGKGRATGSYGYVHANGIKRIVTYIADEKGFRAKIRTNEPGTANVNPAAVKIRSEPYYFPVYRPLRPPRFQRRRHY